MAARKIPRRQRKVLETTQDLDPSVTSSDYDSMSPFWEKVDSVLGGVDAMRDAGQAFLARFADEPQDVYDARLSESVMTNIYKDVVENLANKPFAKKVRLLEEDKAPRAKALMEDIDGRGNNLHVFLWDTLFKGINKAIDWILVDKMPVPVGATVADEQRLGARPYFAHVDARDLIAVYSDVFEGKEQIVHARIKEVVVSREGWTETRMRKVRIFDRKKISDNPKLYAPATFEVWRENTDANGKTTWEKESEGPIAIGVIALVPYVTGRREGTSWVFDPPMKDALDAQVDHYQQENGLKNAKTMTCFPMLAGNGVTQSRDKDGNLIRVPVGPRAVLFAPMDSAGRAGSWQWLEPQATSLEFLAKQLKEKEDHIRELGRAPLTAQSVGLTVVTSAFASQKANSAIQAWALGLKDAAEQAFKYAEMFMDADEEVGVWIHTDFPTESAVEKGPDVILKLRDKREISRVAMYDELKRFNVVSPDYDAEKDEEVIAEEAPEDPTATDVQDALGNLDPADPNSQLTPEQRQAMMDQQRRRQMRVVA